MLALAMATRQRELLPDPTPGPRNTGAGRSRAFEELWPSAAARLERILQSRNVPKWLSEEVVQETGVRIWTGWDRFRFDGDLLPLARTIAGNLITDHHRAATRLVLTADMPDSAADRTDVERSAIARLDLARVREALSGLNPRYREILMAEVGEGDIDEPASLAKVTRLRARQRLHTAIDRLRVLLATPVHAATDLIRRAVHATGQTISGAELQVLLQAALGLAIVLSSFGGPTSPQGSAPLPESATSNSFESGSIGMTGSRDHGGALSPIDRFSRQFSRKGSGRGGHEGAGGASGDVRQPGVSLPGVAAPKPSEWRDGGSITLQGVTGEGEYSIPFGQHVVTLKYRYSALTPTCNIHEPHPCEAETPSAETTVGYGKQKRTVKLGEPEPGR